MSAEERTSPGGQPSTTQPIAGPWLSPKEVTVKTRPNVLPAMGRSPLLLDEVQLDAQFLQLVGTHGRGRFGERTLRALGLRERNHVADRVGAAEEHDQPVETEGDSAMGRCAIFQSLQQESEFGMGLFLADAQQVEDA